MTRESSTQRQIWLRIASLAGVIVFRVNAGRAWLSGAGPARRQADGSVVVPAARPVALGFGLVDGTPVVGAADLCGWRSVEITADMVGCRVAVFASVEVKRADGGGVVGEAQRRWRDTVIAAGGIAGIATSPETAVGIFTSWRPPVVAR